MRKWSVYILSCGDGTLYTGISDDVDSRIQKHNAGLGAKYTRSRLPVTLVYSEVLDDRSSALKREHQIKGLNRKKKISLIEHGSSSASSE